MVTQVKKAERTEKRGEGNLDITYMVTSGSNLCPYGGRDKRGVQTSGQISQYLDPMGAQTTQR